MHASAFLNKWSSHVSGYERGAMKLLAVNVLCKITPLITIDKSVKPGNDTTKAKEKYLITIDTSPVIQGGIWTEEISVIWFGQ
jgi:hypothetical protein